MTLASPRRKFSAAVAALVMAVLLLPSGAAVADEHNAPDAIEVQTPAAVASPSPANHEPANHDDDATPQPEPTESASTQVPQSSAPADVVELEHDVEATHEVPVEAEQQASRSALANAGTALTCEPGYVYSVGDSGQLYEVNLNHSGNNIRTELADFGSGSSYNGLGIGANGGSVYAYQRTGSGNNTRARIVRWDGNGDPVQVANYTHDLNGSLVAGAVDLNTGNYYFGGYETYRHGSSWIPNAHRLRIWRYTPGQGVGYVGHVDTGIRTSDISAANGDFAFNEDGDLFFLVSGNSRAAIGTVTAQALSNASGGGINASVTNPMTLTGQGTIAANGIAFDSDGSILLGTGTHIYRFDPSDWSTIGQRREVLTGSTDLASCNSPSSIEILKDVEGRKADHDQFRLSLHSGSQEVTAATTEGAADGIQDQQVGPTAVRLGNTYRIRETMAAGSSSSLHNDYDTTYVCTVDDAVVANGEGTEFNLTIEHAGETVSCTFTNTPVPDTQLTLLKEFDTSFGAPENIDDWTLTATPTGGQAIEFDHDETKNIDAGRYTIAELFGDDKIAPDAAGYDLADITCTTDGRDNPVTNGQVTLEDRTATECVLTNADRPGAVVWQKTDTDGEHLAGSEWKLTGPQGFGDNGELIVTDNGEHDADDRDGYFSVEGLWWGDYELEEITAPDGYQLLDETAAFTITGTERNYEFSDAFANIAIPTLTLLKGFETQYGAPENPQDWNLFATTGDDELAFDHGETRQVEAGSYTLSETFGDDGQATQDVGYELHEIVCSVDGGASQVLDGELVIEDDTATECTLVNIDLPGAVEWKKTNGDGTPLADSEWSLTGPESFGERTIVDNGEYDVIETAGTIRVEGLHWGDYALEETKAPVGFQLISGTEEFSIAGTAREYAFDQAFINEPLQPGTLPLTGVFSGKWPLIGAAGLALVVLTGLARTLRRRHS